MIPEITLQYAAILGLIYTVLTVTVVVMRGKYKVPFGDGGVQPLLRAIRAHGNFIEYIPLILILMIAYELTGGSALILNKLGLMLVYARTIHVIAMFSRLNSMPYYFGRVVGATTTVGIMAFYCIHLILI